MMRKDASAIFQSHAGTYDELERLSALETLKGLRSPDSVTLGDLVGYLESRGLWTQFAKITLGDLRDAFAPPRTEAEATGRRRKRRILEDELEDAYAEKAEKEVKAKVEEEEEEDSVDFEECARQVLPFVEGNGEVTFEDIEEYCRIDRKVLRRHLAAMVKDGRLERIGVGRHAVYSSAL